MWQKPSIAASRGAVDAVHAMVLTPSLHHPIRSNGGVVFQIPNGHRQRILLKEIITRPLGRSRWLCQPPERGSAPSLKVFNEGSCAVSIKPLLAIKCPPASNASRCTGLEIRAMDRWWAGGKRHSHDGIAREKTPRRIRLTPTRPCRESETGTVDPDRSGVTGGQSLLSEPAIKRQKP